MRVEGYFNKQLQKGDLWPLQLLEALQALQHRGQPIPPHGTTMMMIMMIMMMMSDAPAEDDLVMTPDNYPPAH